MLYLPSGKIIHSAMAVRKPTFDDCYQALPELKLPRNLDRFWQDAILGLKRLPVEPQQKLVLKKSFGKESLSDIAFQSVGPAIIRGQLFVPRRRGKAPVVIHFPDYEEKASFPVAVKDYSRTLTEKGIALLSVELRESAALAAARAARQRQSAASGRGNAANAVEGPPPPIVQMGVDPMEDSYIVRSLLDGLRAVDFIRPQKGIDSARIGLLGRGLGAAIASFLAALRTHSLVTPLLERRSPPWLARSTIYERSACLPSMRYTLRS